LHLHTINSFEDTAYLKPT